VPRLIIESGPDKGAIHALLDAGSFDVGRESGRFLRLQDAKVSRKHCSFHVEPAGFVLEDHGSSNGTFVNGRRVNRTGLRNGDLIRVGDTFLSFSADSADPLVGTTIAGYLIQERIGRGGMGTVYRALQTSLERIVALKVLSPAFVEDRDLVVRFIAEARTAARLDHRHIVRIFDVGEAGGVFFLSMEHMPGGSMQELIDREGRQPVEKALLMARDVARALVWAGENNIVHRDIKPDNLLFALDGSVKVADFGLAADERKSKTLYAGGKVLGTPAHMAPEQALGQRVDHRADLYALGSTLYTALAGTVPYPGDNAIEILVRKTKEAPRPLRELAPGVPEAVAALVERLLARDPGDRHASAREALEEIAAAAERMPAPANSLGAALQRGLRRLRGGK
jgi:serine/threonine protein kinase